MAKIIILVILQETDTFYKPTQVTSSAAWWTCTETTARSRFRDVPLGVPLPRPVWRSCDCRAGERGDILVRAITNLHRVIRWATLARSRRLPSTTSRDVTPVKKEPKTGDFFGRPITTKARTNACKLTMVTNTLLREFLATANLYLQVRQL